MSGRSVEKRARSLFGEVVGRGLLVLGLGVFLAPFSGVAETGPAPIGSTERHAVRLATEYLQEGPEAWWDELADEAPIRDLGRERGRREIALRLGPPGGATWILQKAGPGLPETSALFMLQYPSGMDEIVRLDLDEEGAIREIRTALVPGEIEEPESEDGTGRVMDEIASRETGAPLRGVPTGGSLAILALLTTLSVFTLGFRGTSAAWLPVAVLSLSVLSCGSDPVQEVEAAVVRDGAEDLSKLRNALTRGAAPEVLAELFDALPDEGPAAEMGQLLRADHDLRSYRLNRVEEALEALSNPAARPLGELLRARLAAFRGDEVTALHHYEQVRKGGFDGDALRLEAAQLLDILGDPDRSDLAYSRTAWMGSRRAEPYYAMAESALVEGRDREAEEHFRTAWELEPLDRETLFSEPLLASLCTRERLFPLFDFGSVEEPRVGRAPTDREPLDLPGDARVEIVGETLLVSLDDAELRIPGGAVLAPPQSPVVLAAELSEREEREALSRIGELSTTGSAASVVQPAIRRRMERAGMALLREEKYEELVAMTAGLGDGGDYLPPLLVQLRARALEELGRGSEAVDLLVASALDAKDNRRRDPGSLYQLAELLVDREEYEMALRLLRRANDLTPNDRLASRIRQVEMERKLEEDHGIHESRHFRIRYPRATGVRYARQLTTVLEEERKRLRHWIPVERDEIVDVDLYPVRQFLRSYSGIVGLFDGGVRVPFADLRSLHPQLVAVLSHELAHAMIAQYTGDRAPKWFHEGLAQHVEMGRDSVNPIPELYARGRTLSLPVVEAALNGFSEPQFVELSYSQTGWALHFVEARFGRAGVHEMLAAFRDGLDTEAALERALGLGTEAFDREFWEWARTAAPSVWATEIRRYDEEAELLEVLSEAREEPPARVTKRSRFDRMELPERLARWHRSYADRATPVKESLRPVVAVYRGGEAREVTETCRALKVRVETVLEEGILARAPDDGVRRSLQEAYRRLARLAEACVAGRTRLVLSQLESAERALAEAATALAPYGLAP